jgi:hypothetical protein
MKRYFPLIQLIFIGLFIISCSKLPKEDIRDFLENEVSETNDFIVVSANNNATETLIFYPGGLVDPNSYLKWQDELVSERPSLRVITVRMPSNLAVLNSQKGERLFSSFPNTQTWLVAGHSLGGAMATNFMEKNQGKIDALIYLAAYPADDRLKSSNRPILSVFGELDGLATPTEIKEREELLPDPYFMIDSLDFPQTLENSTMYYEIKGGNHAQFGSYGTQNGDGAATIPEIVQHNLIVFLIREFIERI